MNDVSRVRDDLGRVARIGKVHHVAVVVGDIDASTRFYRDILGLELETVTLPEEEELGRPGVDRGEVALRLAGEPGGGLEDDRDLGSEERRRAKHCADSAGVFGRHEVRVRAIGAITREFKALWP